MKLIRINQYGEARCLYTRIIMKIVYRLKQCPIFKHLCQKKNYSEACSDCPPSLPLLGYQYRSENYGGGKKTISPLPKEVLAKEKKTTRITQYSPARFLASSSFE